MPNGCNQLYLALRRLYIVVQLYTKDCVIALSLTAKYRNSYLPRVVIARGKSDPDPHSLQTDQAFPQSLLVDRLVGAGPDRAGRLISMGQPRPNLRVDEVA